MYMFLYGNKKKDVTVIFRCNYVIVQKDRTEAMPVCSTVFFQRYRVSIIEDLGRG